MGKITHHGRLEGTVDNSLEAEMKCMIKAIEMLSTTHYVHLISRILINSDALYAFDKVKRLTPDPLGSKIHLLLEVLKFKSKAPSQPYYIFRHVKAHSGTGAPRKWVNDWCDRRAKDEMKKYIAELSKASV
jgi:hypothetical protein